MAQQPHGILIHNNSTHARASTLEAVMVVTKWSDISSIVGDGSLITGGCSILDGEYFDAAGLDGAFRLGLSGFAFLMYISFVLAGAFEYAAGCRCCRVGVCASKSNWNVTLRGVETF